MAKSNENGAKKRKSRKPGKAAGSAGRRRNTRASEEVIEPDEIEPVEGEGTPEGDDFDVDVEVEMECDDRTGRRDRGAFGRDGLFGSDGPFGPEGPFGPGGPFGPQGMFGPGGLFGQGGGRWRGGGSRRRQNMHGVNRRRRERMFGPGELRLVLLAMLAEEPRHGYELIKALEEQTQGAYSPSPGTIYPTLQLLADEGAIAAQESEDARKLYQATEQGQAELEERKDELEDLWQRLGRRFERRAESSRPSGSPDLFRSLGNLASVLTNKASKGGLNGMDKDQVIDLIDELARKIERL